MAWPRTGAGAIATGSVATGDATTMRWGTKGVVTRLVGSTSASGSGTDVSAYLIVTRISQKRKKEDLQYDNGDGVQSGRMQIFHGVQWDITIREDTRFGIPTENTYVTVCDMAGHLGAIGLTYGAYVLTADVDTAPKQPGERVLSCERIKLIETS